MIHHSTWLHDRILASQPKTLRMPLLCALNKSLAAPILSEGWNEITRGLNTHYYQLNKNETYITSIALTDNTIVAMGSGNPNGDLYFIKENATDKENETASSRFQEIYHSQLQRPIYSLDWAKRQLLVGSNEGITHIYDTQRLDWNNQSEDQLEFLGEYRSQHIPACFSAPPGKCAPNSHIKTVAFNPTYSGRAVSNGTDSDTKDDNSQERSTHFLTTAASHVELWDVNYPGNTNLHCLEPDDSPANVARWSLLSPSLVVTGSEAGHLYVADLRVKEDQGVVWKVPEAHSCTPIRDAQFNPFIPYWLASGGDDNVVNIWDLRATCHQPLAKIDGHHAPITSIAWANARPEKLATTSRDGTFRIWSLSESTIPIWDSYYHMAHRDSRRKSELPQLEHWWPGPNDLEAPLMDDSFGINDADMLTPEDGKTAMGAFGIGAWGKLQIGPLYYGDLHKHSKGSVVKVLVSQTRPGLFYCATSFGQLCSQIFRPTTRGALDYPHRYDFEKDPLCYTIDNSIHYRHIHVANNLIENLKGMPIKDEEQKRIRDDRVQDFEDCLKLLPPIQENDWVIDSIPAQDSKRLWTEADMWQCALNVFRKDLAYWRTRLPPGCNSVFGEIPLDTGDLHPRLSSQLMKGVDFTLDQSNPTFPWDQAILPSFDDASARKSQPDVETASKSQTKNHLRRSSTTPNLTSDDLLATFTDLKNLNERNSSGTVLNTGANWTPLQRAKTAAVPKQAKKITRQPSLSPSSIRSIFTKSNKRQESPLRHQTGSPVRQGSPLGQEGLEKQQSQRQQSYDTPSHQHTPVSLRDEPISGQETPLSQQDIATTRQESSPSMQKETQPKKITNPFTRQDSSRGQKSRLPIQRKKKQPSRQQQTTPPAQQENQQQHPSPIQHEPTQQSEKLLVGTSSDNQHANANTVADTNMSPPQQIDIKSIIKYGSFGHPSLQGSTANKSSIGASASANNLSTMENTNNPFTRNMSSDALATDTTTNSRSPILTDEPMTYSSGVGSNDGELAQAQTINKTDDDTDRSHISRQHAALLAPAKSIRRAFTKKLGRKKTRSSSSSSVSSNNPIDRDPQHYRQQPQLDTSRPSSRNAL